MKRWVGMTFRACFCLKMDEIVMIMILASLPGPLSERAKGGKKRWPVHFTLCDGVAWLYRAFLQAKRGSNRLFHLRLSEVAKRAGEGEPPLLRRLHKSIVHFICIYRCRPFTWGFGPHVFSHEDPLRLDALNTHKRWVQSLLKRTCLVGRHCIGVEASLARASLTRVHIRVYV